MFVRGRCGRQRHVFFVGRRRLICFYSLILNFKLFLLFPRRRRSCFHLCLYLGYCCSLERLRLVGRIPTDFNEISSGAHRTGD